MLRAFSPRSESVVLKPDQGGNYHQVVGKNEVEVEGRNFGNDGWVEVTFECPIRAGHYFFAMFLAFLIASQSYEKMRKEAARSDEEIDDFCSETNEFPNEDALYERHLQEDMNRRLCPRPKLEEDFQIWKSHRDSPHDV